MIEFRILGPLEVIDHEPLSLGGHKQRAVLAVLLLHRGEAVAADRLIEAIWAGRAPATAGKTLQVYISNLRKPLGEGLLITQGRGYLLATEPDQLDSDRFEKLAARGREALDHGELQKARTWLEAALSLWRGPALADFSYESFAQSEIARLEEVRMAALESRIEADLRLGRHAALVPELEALVHDHPLRERLYEQLMLALYRSGRQVDALERYQRARRKLIDDFGIEPGPRLQELQRAVLTHDSTLDLPGRRPVRRLTGPSPSGALRRATALARRLLLGIVALLASLRAPLSRLRRPSSVVPEQRNGRRPRLPAQPGARLHSLQQAMRRQLASGMWAVAAAGAVLILALVLVITIGGHSHARAHKRKPVADWAGISSPATGGVYVRGQLVATSFSCGRPSGGPPLKACTDSTGTATASGGRGHLDTSTIGPHRYTVVATVNSGTAKTTSITYTVAPPLTVSLASAVAIAAHSRTNATLACSGGGTGASCRGTLSLTVQRRVVRRVGRGRAAVVEMVTLGRATYSLAAGASRSIMVPLTNAGVLALRAAPGHRLSVQATIALAGGMTVQRTITLRRRH